MNPPIYEGAAGLSSYESVNGLGQYVPMSGLGVVTPTDACPPITTTFMPPGIINHDTNGKQICNIRSPTPTSDANAALCNRTADPLSCWFSRERAGNFKNRQLKGEDVLWRAWNGSSGGGATAPSAQAPAPADPGAASDNTMLYVGLGVGALVLIGGAVWYKKKQKSKMAANRGSRRH